MKNEMYSPMIDGSSCDTFLPLFVSFFLDGEVPNWVSENVSFPTFTEPVSTPHF